MPNFSSKRMVISVVVLALVSGGIFFWYQQQLHTQYSRIWMEYAMDIVKEKKPSPPASARFYAYVATVYAEVLEKTKSQYQANLATGEIINVLYPDFSTNTAKKLESLAFRQKGSLNSEADSIIARYKDRIAKDKAQEKQPERPSGEEYWNGDKPIEPAAGSWQRWIVRDENFSVPTPPVYGSSEYKEALGVVKNSMNINNTQAKAINFWGGAPGTEAPAGIWQNRLRTVTQQDGVTDKEYAYIQMVLAQSLADAFMECWKIKYTYWTKRPSMGDPTIDLIWMANPNFPSYVSGHSTISFTAATVLGTLLPQYADIWNRDAEEAKNSRLWSGIHFSHDNEEGKALGKRVGEVIIDKLDLQKMRNERPFLRSF